MSRCVINVSTGSYRRGQQRLATNQYSNAGAYLMAWDKIPDEWPMHTDKPYAFKAYAMRAAAEQHDTLLWCDACIVPIRDMTPLWEKIENEGAWISRNGWANAEWTADSAYADLFPEFTPAAREGLARAINREIPHVVATAFGLSLKHAEGRYILDEYYRLASQTRGFCGPWINASSPEWLSQPGAQERRMGDGRVAVCGPPDVRGHRHDQTALSVLAWRQGVELTDPPAWFSYAGGETGETILVADGAY